MKGNVNFAFDRYVGRFYSPVNDIVFKIDFGIFDFHQCSVGRLEEMMANGCSARSFVFDDLFVFNFFSGTNNLSMEKFSQFSSGETKYLHIFAIKRMK